MDNRRSSLHPTRLSPLASEAKLRLEGSANGNTSLGGAVSVHNGASGDLSPTQLAATLCIDQRRSWHNGNRLTAADYARQFPQIDSDQELLLDLVYNEYLLWHQFGLRPCEEEFVARYPMLADELSRLFAVHCAIESGEGLPPLDSQDGFSPWEQDAKPTDGVERGGSRVSGAKLGGYELLEEIGRGGMGVVYKARQPGTQRTVALKVILAGAFASARDVARFRSEAMAAARLDHPGIVPVYEFGRDGQLFYYSMAYIEGKNLAHYLAGRKLAPTHAAELVRPIALAVHYAHTLGITHRDLKPQNILIDQEGRPRIVDFGLAKSESQEGSLTITGQLLGTANYLAPEQAKGEQREIGPASDLFAIGAILYELLTGGPPFAAPTIVAVLSKVVRDDPSSPRTLDPSIPRDLETICLKCLMKNPASRYASAQALGDDLERFLEGRSILARPIPWWERAWRWCRRYPLVAALTAAIAMLAVLLAFSNKALRQQRDRAIVNEQRAQETNRQSQLHLAQAHLNEARALRLSRHAGQRLLSLDAVSKAARLFQDLGQLSSDVVGLRNEVVACLPLHDIDLQIAQAVGAHGPDTTRLAFDADLRRYAVIGQDNMLKIHDFQSNQVLTRFSGDWPGLANLCFSPDGKHLATVDQMTDANRVLLWTIEEATEEPTDLGECSSGSSVLDFSTDGKTLAIVDDQGAIRLLDVASGQESQRLAYNDFAARGCRFQPSENGPALQSRLAIWKDNVVRIVKLEDMAHTDYVHEPHQAIQHVAWSYTCDEFATGLSDHNACTWRLDNPAQPYTTLRGHQSWVRRVAYRPGSHVLTTSSSDGTTRFWNAATGAELFRADGYCLDFSRDGRHIGGVLNGRLARWEFIEASECATLGTPNSYEAYLGAISPSGRWLATGAWNGILIWDFQQRKPVASLYDNAVQTLAFSPDGKSIFAGTHEGILRWTVADNLSWATTEPIGPERIGPEEIGCPASVSFSDDARLLAVSQSGGSYLAERSDGEPGRPRPPRSRSSKPHYQFSTPIPGDWIVVSRRGDYVATASRGDRSVEIYRLNSDSGMADTPIAHWKLSEAPTAIRFNPQGRGLWVTTAVECLKFDCGSWQQTGRIACGAKSVDTFDFSPDGQWLAIGRSDFSIELIDAATLEPYVTLPSKAPGPWVRFSPDGAHLICYGHDANTILWDLQLVRRQFDELGLDGR